MAKKKATDEVEEEVKDVQAKAKSDSGSFEFNEDWFSRNSKKISIAAVALLVVMGGLWFFQNQSATKAGKAIKEMARNEGYFRIDSFDLALNGGGELNAKGFKKTISRYGSTPSGNLSRLYAGICNMKLGNYGEAVKQLKAYDSGDDYFISAKAKCLLGDAYMEQDKFSEAISAYEEAVKNHPNGAFTPGYMMKLGLAYELKGSNAEAVKNYEQLLANYPTSQEASKAKKYKALAQSKTKN